jgi:hypothetical protein
MYVYNSLGFLLPLHIFGPPLTVTQAFAAFWSDAGKLSRKGGKAS